MITINGRMFARNKAEASNTLFQSGGTFTGFYKPVKGGLVLSDMQGKPRAAVVSFGIVNAGRDNRGKMFYQYALGIRQALWLGSIGLEENPRENREAAESLLAQAAL